jgi:hypothetical protein
MMEMYNLTVDEAHTFFVGDGQWLVHNCPSKARVQNLGKTPGKDSSTGQAVFERMKGEGTARDLPDGTKEIYHPDSGWVKLDSNVDMAHTTDAVTYWNTEGKYYGQRAPEVRAFMTNSDNYVLQPRSVNRSAGAKLGQTYDPPVPRAP